MALVYNAHVLLLNTIKQDIMYYADCLMCFYIPFLSQVDFDETFQEPEGSESIAIVWKYNRAIYTYTLVSCK